MAPLCSRSRAAQTFWLLDARSGAVRWRLVNGSRPAAIDHGGEMICVTYVSGTVQRDTRKPPVHGEQPWFRNQPLEEVRRYHELLVTSAELVALRTEDGAVTWRLEGWVRPNQPQPIVRGGRQLDGDVLITDVTDFADATPVISALDAQTGAVRWRYTGTDTPETGDARGTHPTPWRLRRQSLYLSGRHRTVWRSSTPLVDNWCGAVIPQNVSGISRQEARC